jgi:hypothetical protein
MENLSKPPETMVQYLESLVALWTKFNNCKKGETSQPGDGATLFKEVVKTVKSISSSFDGQLKKRFDSYVFNCYVIKDLCVFAEILDYVQGKGIMKASLELDPSQVEEVQVLVYKFSTRCFNLIPRDVKPKLCSLALSSLFSSSSPLVRESGVEFIVSFLFRVSQLCFICCMY